jgi:hypothetical protein
MAWLSAGVVANAVLSWPLLAAAWIPGELAQRVLPKVDRARAWFVPIGFALAGTSLASFSFASPVAVAAIPVAFGAATLATCALIRARTLATLGGVALLAALGVLVAITLPPLLANPAALDFLYAEDMAGEMLQALLAAVAARVLWRMRRGASRKGTRIRRAESEERAMPG